MYPVINGALDVISMVEDNRFLTAEYISRVLMTVKHVKGSIVDLVYDNRYNETW